MCVPFPLLLPPCLLARACACSFALAGEGEPQAWSVWGKGRRLATSGQVGTFRLQQVLILTCSLERPLCDFLRHAAAENLLAW